MHQYLLKGQSLASADSVIGSALARRRFVLGFSETSAFSRAYKRWTGRPPKLA
jgi:hypothetical protein